MVYSTNKPCFVHREILRAEICKSANFSPNFLLQQFVRTLKFGAQEEGGKRRLKKKLFISSGNYLMIQKSGNYLLIQLHDES